MHTRRWLLAAGISTALVLGTPLPAVSADDGPLHAAAPYSVEDGAYPGRGDILSLTGADLIAGDGNITLTSCEGPYQIKVWAVKLKTGDSRVCFASADSGYLSVSIPRAYRIETSGRDIKAGVSIGGTTENLDVARNTSKGFGEADPSDPKEAVLLEMRVTGSGDAAPQQPAGNFPAWLGKLRIGDTRSCTAVLVDPRWVMTAKSCFADKPAESTEVSTGAPKNKTFLTVGRNDINAVGGHSTEIVQLVPRTDRDVVLARLKTPAYGITPVALAAAAPALGQELTVSGFGRTSEAWHPDRAHAAAFNTGASTAVGFDITAKAPADATVCKGDAGAAAVRIENGQPALAAVVSRSRQGACLDAASAEAGAFAARVDDLGAWVKSTRQLPVLLKGGETLQPGEMLASENAKLIMQADGNLVLYHVTGGEGRGGALWSSGTWGNAGAFAKMQADGNLVVYKKGSNGSDASGALWAAKTDGNTGARLELQNDANLVVYTKDGGHGIGGHLWHSDTYQRGDRLATDIKLTPGAWLTNGKQAMLLDIEGNISVREISTGRELWGKVTWNKGAYLHMQGDGNLVLYKKGTGNGTGGLWSTGTAGGTGSYANLDNSGSLVVRWKEGGLRWASLSLRGVQSGRCLDFDGTANTTIWGCWGGANQQWDYTPAKELRTDSGAKCLTAQAGAPQSSRVMALPCDGRAEQKWTYDGATIKSAVKPDQCVNVFSEATADGSAVGLWACSNSANSKWARL
ncbi:hypothetical protein EF912_09715 [Streptomyces sp. WAC07061]|uniref:ricin-type beta-trefoil lectin domain protein n=1 Tax=Streptomyces sp. WAC07061 TaxID=2487410 RepID=UPI000F7663F6|nr:ricin-type beta-trefoil lectin domain protein [Streptomyces sp. WAC07061]RSS60533.1 hypothetical protein EF912_09715 [Streptomyces sp. WAC07061]